MCNLPSMGKASSVSSSAPSLKARAVPALTQMLPLRPARIENTVSCVSAIDETFRLPGACQSLPPGEHLCSVL
jgi:hypothetical protein